ncbi:glycosyltransferase family 2 protein [Acidobacteriota bacterium]
MSFPEISIIIPTYNRCHIVGRAIKSVLKQTYGKIEIIIVDDCSSDKTEHIIKEISKVDTRVRYFRTEKNIGGAATRNRGVSESHGKYIAFLDDDDEALPEWLEKSMEKISTLPESWGLLCCRWYQKSEFTHIIYESAQFLKDGYIYKELLRGHDPPSGTSGSVVKREAYDYVGGFDESLHGLQDYDFFFSLARKWTFHYLQIPLIVFYIHPGFRISDTNRKREDAFNHFFKKWEKEIIRIGGRQTLELMRSKRLAGLFFSRIHTEIISKGRFSALKQLIRSFSRNNFRFAYFIKSLMLIFVGPVNWDRGRRIRGKLYWKARGQ